MKRKLLSLFLTLTLAASLLAGCQVKVSMDGDKPDVDLHLGDVEEFLQSGNIDLQLGDNGPRLSLDLGSLLPQELQESAADVGSIPPYSGKPYIAVNNNTPFFTEEEITADSFEDYSRLDRLGRCGVTMASIGRDLMPTEKRESIQEVRPTGWVQNQYDWVDGRSLYNRCHLIGFQLAGENANDRNLITSTRSMNIHGMLPFENMVADYVKETNNHVMYRVTPIFEGNDLVAQGVLMEGLSVEDQGDGVTFCIFAYNAEPGVTIDYATGENWASEKETASDSGESTTYILNTGSRKFHLPGCPGAEDMNPANRETFEGTRQELLDMGYQPCGSCNP